jgi:hypothetical protein
MAEGEGGGGGVDPFIWLFFIVLLAMAFGAGGTGGFFGGKDDIRFGSPSISGTVEEEVRASQGGILFGGGNNPPQAPAPNPVPTPGTPASKPIISSPSSSQILLEASGNARLPYESEHISVYVPSNIPGRIVLSGMVLRNRNNESAVIGNDENGNPIILSPGERVVISTKFSPRGFNFKLNKCSGYLSQSISYSPGISTSCPHVSNLEPVRNFSEKCILYLQRIGYCQTPLLNYESGIDNQCAGFIGEHASYTGCVRDFKNDANFDQKEWRVYLGRQKELWSDLRDDIYLYSQSGILISKTSY